MLTDDEEHACSVDSVCRGWRWAPCVGPRRARKPFAKSKLTNFRCVRLFDAGYELACDFLASAIANRTLNKEWLEWQLQQFEVGAGFRWAVDKDIV